MTNALTRYRHGRAPLEWGEEGVAIQTTARLLAILDLSGSMDRRDAGEEGSQRRVEVLQEALDELGKTFPGQVVAVGFNTEPFVVNLYVGPLPGRALHTLTKLVPVGSTNLYRGLVYADNQARAIGNVVLVGDGQPTDGKIASSCALVREWKDAGVRFSVVYCGPQGGRGEQTLRRLAEAGDGSFHHCQVKADELLEALSEALLLEAPDVIRL